MDGDLSSLGLVLSHFSWDVPWLIGLVLPAGWYVRAFLKARALPERRRHDRRRAVFFLSGLLLVGVSVLSPLEYYGNQVLWLNFTGFLLLTMIAAPLIVLGSPLTLAFRVNGKAGRARLRRFSRSQIVRRLTFPPVAWLLFAVVTFLWQLTRLTDIAAQDVFVRDAQQVSLLAVAVLFWTPALCADPLRWRMPFPLRALYVFVEMTHKALFGAVFLSLNRPMHHYFATHLPGWAPSPMLDQRVAIGTLWVGGNVIFLSVLVGLIIGWMRYEARSTHRIDRRLALRRAAERQRQVALDQVFGRSSPAGRPR